MNADYHTISWIDLALSSGFLLLASGISFYCKLGVHKDLFVGGIRCFLQLALVGYLLEWIFGVQSALLVLCMLFFMGCSAMFVLKGRLKQNSNLFFWPTFIALQSTFFLITLVVSSVIIRADPWWSPHLLIPIGGMIAGNSMNAIALALERFFTDLKKQGPLIEMRLLLGATVQEASEDIFRNALRTGMIPAINSLMGVGIVALPGMMTGQILAGINPQEAVRYQVLVMLMLVAATAIVSFLTLFLVRRRCFGKAMQLLVR